MKLASAAGPTASRLCTLADPSMITSWNCAVRMSWDCASIVRSMVLKSGTSAAISIPTNVGDSLKGAAYEQRDRYTGNVRKMKSVQGRSMVSSLSLSVTSCSSCEMARIYLHWEKKVLRATQVNPDWQQVAPVKGRLFVPS